MRTAWDRRDRQAHFLAPDRGRPRKGSDGSHGYAFPPVFGEKGRCKGWLFPCRRHHRPRPSGRFRRAEDQLAGRDACRAKSQVLLWHVPYAPSYSGTVPSVISSSPYAEWRTGPLAPAGRPLHSSSTLRRRGRNEPSRCAARRPRPGDTAMAEIHRRRVCVLSSNCACCLLCVKGKSLDHRTLWLLRAAPVHGGFAYLLALTVVALPSAQHTHGPLLRNTVVFSIFFF